MTSVFMALQALGIPCREFHHSQPVTSLEQAAAERGQIPAQVVRSIVFRLSAESYIMALMAGPTQISWARLRAYLGQNRISLASDEEVLTVTGYKIGTVSPIATAKRMRVLVDASVFVHEEISLGSGQRDIAVVMRSADLRLALPELELGKFASDA
jgi:prolyl-tRNA editing enzyme YbaK/EbsC (Cys-tRNA(Pro) deacylase)